ncbi:GNAT family N-acetyltransferase [Nakamurella silvestris]|nr:GNAT family N-acetyltransferase [Nakamurella silvestris]
MSAPSDAQLLARFNSAARAGAIANRTVTTVGPFTLTVTEDNEHPYLNYAVVDDDAVPSAEDVTELINSARAAGRIPRVEFIPGRAPQVSAALLAADFQTQDAVTVLACTPEDLVAPPENNDLSVDIRTGEGTPDWFLIACANTMNRSFGEPVPPGGPDIEGLRQALSDTGSVALAREGCGAPAGAGRVEPIREGIAELNSIGVLADMRGQGIGGTITAELTAAAFARGAQACVLAAAGPDEMRVYQRVGYHEIGHQLFLWIPPAD